MMSTGAKMEYPSFAAGTKSIVTGNEEIVSVNNKAARLNTTSQSTTTATPQLKKVDNAIYRIVAKVIYMTMDKCSMPIAALLHGMLNGESFALSQSSISAMITSLIMHQVAPRRCNLQQLKMIHHK
jgi:hypothetical protein